MGSECEFEEGGADWLLRWLREGIGDGVLIALLEYRVFGLLGCRGVYLLFQIVLAGVAEGTRL